MDAARSCREEKTILCGHWHCSYGHFKYEHRGSEFGPDADFSPYYGEGVIALDADRRNTLKKYGGTDKTERRAMLLYCNRRVYGDKVIYVDQLECQGVVSHVIKKK